MSEAKTCLDPNLSGKLQSMAEAVNPKLSKLNIVGKVNGRESQKLAKEIAQAQAEMKDLAIKEVLKEEIAKANRLFNAKQKYSTSGSSENTDP